MVRGNLPGDSVGRVVPRPGAHARQAGPSPRTSAPPRGPGRGRLPSAAQASRKRAHSTRGVTWGDDAPELPLSSAREGRLDAHVSRELHVPAGGRGAPSSALLRDGHSRCRRAERQTNRFPKLPRHTRISKHAFQSVVICETSLAKIY